MACASSWSTDSHSCFAAAAGPRTCSCVYSAANTAQQIALIKNLGLNGIRTEGKQMPRDFYEQMDRAGILIDAGYQCCDAVAARRAAPERRRLQDARSLARGIGEQLRDHPSVMNFSWSDNAPTPRQEKVSLRGFAQRNSTIR